jgi:hypothetical protein
MTSFFMFMFPSCCFLFLTLEMSFLLCDYYAPPIDTTGFVSIK